MCLSGTGALATAFEVNSTTLMAEYNLITPTINELWECRTTIKVTIVDAPDKNSLVTYPGSVSFLPAPWLVDTVIAANSSNPFLLITVANAAATVFNRAHKEDPEYITPTENHAADFILWAWGIGAGQVDTASFIFDPTNIDLKRFTSERHQACIISSVRVTWAAVPGGLPPPPAAYSYNMAVLGLLNTTILRQADKQEEQNKILTKQLKHMIKKEWTSKNCFKNLHDSTIQMIIFASALDSNEIPYEQSSPASTSLIARW